MENREIKFRAWDKRKKRFIQIELGNFNGKAGIEIKPYSLQEIPNECVFQQFTGLKDKSGKEIYEGDIFVSTENDEVYVVGNILPLSRHLDFLAENVGYFTDKNRKKFQKRSAGSQYHLDDWVSNPEFYEVIGNIYENPELLK